MKFVTFVVFTVLNVCSTVITIEDKPACKIAMWQKTSAIQRLSISPIVVFGETEGYLSRGDIFDAEFKVHCIFKSDGIALNHSIVLEAIYPRQACSGTRSGVMIGEKIIAGIRRLDNGNFEWHEENPLETVAFDGSYSFLEEISSTCDLQNWTVPLGGNDSECPVCAGDFGVINENNTCMMDNLYMGTCTPVPEFQIFSVCDCSILKGGTTVLSGSGRVETSAGLVLLLCMLSIL